jgi:hypothetical protein
MKTNNGVNDFMPLLVFEFEIAAALTNTPTTQSAFQSSRLVQRVDSRKCPWIEDQQRRK